MNRLSIYRAVERGLTSVPLSELMSKDGGLNLYEDVIESGYFNISLKGKRVQLKAGDFVGFIPLNDRVALLVEPKIGRENWLHIVNRARGELKVLNYSHLYAHADNLSGSLLEFLIRVLVFQLNAIEQYGLYRQYKPLEEQTNFPRGRFLFGETIKRDWRYGQRRPITVRYHIFSRDTPFNRLLKYALFLAENYLARIGGFDTSFRRRLSELEDLFSGIPVDTSLKYLPEVQLALRQNAIPEARAYYADACETALLLVENKGMVPTLSGYARTLSFVINMGVVFQEYCFRVLSEASLAQDSNLIVFDKRSGERPLFYGGNDSRKAEADIVVANLVGDPKLIVEVKYKKNPTREDLNQVITYGTVYGTNNVILLCYAGETQYEGLEFLGFAGPEVKVWIYRIDLSQSNLKEAENKMVSCIGKVMQ